MNKTTLAVLSCAALLSACNGGPARPQLTEMTHSDGSRVLLTYDGDKLTTMKAFDKDGKAAGESTYQFIGNNISSVTHQGSNGAVVIYSCTYLDGRLSAISGSGANFSYNLSVTYAEGRVARTLANTTSGEITVTQDRTSTYNGGRLTQQTESGSVKMGGLSASSTATSTYAYDDKNRVTTITRIEGTDSDVSLFSYDDAGLLVKVVNGDTTNTLEYKDGKVVRTTSQSKSDTSFLDYTYANGDVAGWIGNPLVSSGELFDLAGRQVPQDQVYLGSLMLLSAL